jgi:enoyl-CoA hydratase
VTAAGTPGESGEPLVLVEVEGGVCTVTLHRPTARNALNSALHEASAAALWEAERDDAVDVVVLTGSDPAFCAGLDLRELGTTGANLRGAQMSDGPPSSPFEAVLRLTKPVIGAINGPAITGGLELALGCDFIVASERALFADTHARVGVSPGAGMSVFLPMAVGLRYAKEMSFTGNLIDAATALRVGLVNRVVPHEDLLTTARAIAADIASSDARGVRHLKWLYDTNARLPLGEAFAHELEVFATYAVDPAEVERRRADVVDRGQHQRRS